jgi:hypothetical protein
MKLLAIVSALDLNETPAGTMVWWQLLKALNETGVNVIVSPFIGKPVDTPWWRCYKNPSEATSKSLYYLARKSSSFKTAKNAYKKGKGSFLVKSAKRALLPRWCRFVDDVMKKDKGIDAVAFCSVPANLLETLPSYIERRWGIPSIYYEIDMPDILPSFGGFHFSYYSGVDLSEYSLFLSNSGGVTEDLKEMGATNIDTLFFGADPDIYSPVAVEKDTDIFFSGIGTTFREDWIKKMLIDPSMKDTRMLFSVSGKRFAFSQGRIRFLGYLPFTEWKAQCCASRINLNISRKPHAEIAPSSTLRIFEFCSLGACVVSNKHLGLEKWFTPGKELFVIDTNDEPLDLYHHLLNDPDLLEKTGKAARDRILLEHTYRHRAKKLVDSIKRIL